MRYQTASLLMVLAACNPVPDSAIQLDEGFRGFPEGAMRRDEASGILQPSGSPLEQPVRIDAGESCIVDLTQSYTISGSLSGTVVFNYRILVKGPYG